jgi:hypothetical protein
MELPSELIDLVLIADCYPHLYAVNIYYSGVWKRILIEYKKYREPIIDKTYLKNTSMVIASYKQHRCGKTKKQTVVFADIFLTGNGMRILPHLKVICRDHEATHINPHIRGTEILDRPCYAILRNCHELPSTKCHQRCSHIVVEYIYYEDILMCELSWRSISGVGRLPFDVYLKLLKHRFSTLRNLYGIKDNKKWNYLL